MAGQKARTLTKQSQGIQFIDSIDLPWKNEAANKDFLIQKYVVEGLSMNQIAVLIGASKLTVWHALKDFGIPTRSKSQGQKMGRKSQMRYGYRRVNGTETPHVGEQRVIGVAKELCAQGISLRRIAQILTKMQVPTKLRGKSWHPEMVSRILKDAKES